MRKLLSIITVFLISLLGHAQAVPEWIDAALNGDVNAVAQELGINKDKSKIFIFCASPNENEKYDIKSSIKIDALISIEKSFSGILTTAGNTNKVSLLNFEFETIIAPNGINNSMRYYFNANGIRLPLMESNGESVIRHPENYQKILANYANRDIIENLTLAAEQFVFTEKASSKSKKQKFTYNIVDFGTSPITSKKYDNAIYYAVYTIPNDVYEKCLYKAAEQLNK